MTRATDAFDKYRGATFMESRIPILDALTLLLPAGQPLSAAAQAVVDEKGVSRWYPEGEHLRVRVPFEGQAYDSEVFQLEKGGWDHEHCNHCQDRIEPMTLCWVTRSGPYWLLCAVCKTELDRTQPSWPRRLLNWWRVI